MHSAIYTVLLVVWLVPGLHALEAIFGMAHGLGWIAMSLACIAAAAPARHRPAPRRGRRRARRDRPVHRLLRVRAPEPAARRRRSGSGARLTSRHASSRRRGRSGRWHAADAQGEHPGRRRRGPRGPRERWAAPRDHAGAAAVLHRRRHPRRRHLRAGRPGRGRDGRRDLGGVPRGARRGGVHRGLLRRARRQVPARGRRRALRPSRVRQLVSDVRRRVRGRRVGHRVGERAGAGVRRRLPQRVRRHPGDRHGAPARRC